MGANILEFHFTDTRKGKKFRDHKISLDINDTKELVFNIRRINLLKGTFEKKPTKSEILSGHIKSFRRAVYSTKLLKAGEQFRNKNLKFLRPNVGLDPRDLKKSIGKKIKKKTYPLQRIILI